MNQDKTEKLSRDGFVRILGRIHICEFDRDPVTRVAPPFLLLQDGRKKFPIEGVVRALESREWDNHDQVVSFLREPGLRPDDVTMVRAYVHRFGSDLNCLSSLPEGNRDFLLDENMPPAAMLTLSRNFGWATHVQVEGLAGRATPDQLIWDYARDKGIGTIVTQDSDFLSIQRRNFDSPHPEGLPPPHILFVEGRGVSAGNFSNMLRTHWAQVSALIRDDDSPGCRLKFSEQVCCPLF